MGTLQHDFPPAVVLDILLTSKLTVQQQFPQILQIPGVDQSNAKQKDWTLREAIL